jgi:hypothetical protein
MLKFKKYILLEKSKLEKKNLILHNFIKVNIIYIL